MNPQCRLLTNNWKTFSLALLTVSTVMVLSTVATVGQARKPTMVFAVSAESGDGSMDAVVLVAGKQLRVPFNDEQKDRQKKSHDYEEGPCLSHPCLHRDSSVFKLKTRAA